MVICSRRQLSPPFQNYFDGRHTVYGSLKTNMYVFGCIFHWHPARVQPWHQDNSISIRVTKSVIYSHCHLRIKSCIIRVAELSSSCFTRWLQHLWTCVLFFCYFSSLALVWQNCLWSISNVFYWISFFCIHYKFKPVSKLIVFWLFSLRGNYQHNRCPGAHETSLQQLILLFSLS